MRKALIVTGWLSPDATDPSYRPQIVSLVSGCSDQTGQSVGDIEIARDAYTVEALLTDEQLATIKANTNYVVLWDIDVEAGIVPDLDAAELDALKTQLANVYSTDVVELVTLDKSNPADITTDLITAQRRPPWQAGISVGVGEVYQYSGNLYEVIQSHTTQADWTPDISFALFKRFYEPANDPWPWVQPQGAHDAYPIGARVTHNGYTWQSDVSANVWEPGVFGWTNLTPPPPTPDWSYPVVYQIGDHVIYNGVEYVCIQAHTSQAGWTPPVVPALWQVI